MDLLAHARMVMWEGGNLLVVNASPFATRTIKRTEPHATTLSR